MVKAQGKDRPVLANDLPDADPVSGLEPGMMEITEEAAQRMTEFIGF